MAKIKPIYDFVATFNVIKCDLGETGFYAQLLFGWIITIFVFHSIRKCAQNNGL